MKIRSRAWAALCATAFLALQAQAETASGPVRLTAAEMDRVTAGGGRLDTLLDDGRRFAVEVMDANDEPNRRIVLTSVDATSGAEITQTIGLGDGDWEQTTAFAGTSVSIRKAGEQVEIKIPRRDGETVIASTPSSFSSATVQSGQGSTTNSTSIISGPIDASDLQNLIERFRP
jgi:uncharacterized protein YndB with AHSA1/START domain